MCAHTHVCVCTHAYVHSSYEWNTEDNFAEEGLPSNVCEFPGLNSGLQASFIREQSSLPTEPSSQSPYFFRICFYCHLRCYFLYVFAADVLQQPLQTWLPALPLGPLLLSVRSPLKQFPEFVLLGPFITAELWSSPAPWPSPCISLFFSGTAHVSLLLSSHPQQVPKLSQNWKSSGTLSYL